MFRSEYDEIKANLIKKSLEKDKTEVIVPIERRKGKDIRLKFINIMCFCVWIILFIIIALIEKVFKNTLYLYENFLGMNLLTFVLCVTLVCILICSICIILNFTRHKRRSDKIKKSLVIAEVVSFIIAIFLISEIF